MQEDKPLARSEQVATVRDFQNLLESPAWVRLSKIVKAQLEARVNEVMLVPAGVGEGNPISVLLHAEYMKGEYNGLVSAMQLPQVQVDMINAMLANEEPEDAPGTENT